MSVHEEFAKQAADLLQPTIAAMNAKWKGNIQLKRSLFDSRKNTGNITFKLVSGLKTLAIIDVDEYISVNSKERLIDRIYVRPSTWSLRKWGVNYRAIYSAHEIGVRQKPPETIADELIAELEQTGVMKRLRPRSTQAKAEL